MRIPVTIYQKAENESLNEYSTLWRKFGRVKIVNIGGTLYFKYQQRIGNTE